MKKSLLFFLAVFALIQISARAAEPVRIGLTLGLTGKYTEMSAMQMKGYRLWKKQVNDRGGIAGRPVELIIRDDGSDGPAAAGLYEEMMGSRKVDLVFGPYASAITAAILPAAERHGYPVLVGGAFSDQPWSQGRRNVFGVYTPASRYTVGFLEMLVASGVDRLAILATDDVFSQSAADGAAKWAGRYGLEVVYRETFPKDKQELDDEIGRARESGASLLIMCGHLQEAVSGREALSRAGWQPAAYYATVGPVLQEYADRLGPLAEGTFSSSQWEPDPDLDFPGSRQFLEEFTATYSTAPSYHAATAFATGTILEQAVHRAGGIDREKLTEALFTLDTMSIIGRYGVDRTGMQIRQFPVITQWQEGRKEITWPEEIKTADPVFGRTDHD
ncbi:MAG: amino acid ABC transporter substrate-binding protein [bacterium]|nr:amino acid ABC transporter substrate-binding protein [bacterium]MDT8396505.1 amino acid ABC transporter substrate-binding protein [bacterium]